ncbi:phage portal protein, partial [Gemella sp. zg-1178]|uniref:phage portal protein n=1 Tax=Gemella sp. zg-1178 TaxID=2840372 RepID=UPI001C05CF08|nr:phage portal protein [Gemella sp. zg-1178]
MMILSRLFKSRDKPINKLSGNNHSFFIGQTASGKRVNEKTAMQMTAVYSCVRILSETLASLPLHIYEITDLGSKKATNHYLYNLLHNEPNNEMTSFIFRETLMTH